MPADSPLTRLGKQIEYRRITRRNSGDHEAFEMTSLQMDPVALSGSQVVLDLLPESRKRARSCNLEDARHSVREHQRGDDHSNARRQDRNGDSRSDPGARQQPVRRRLGSDLHTQSGIPQTAGRTHPVAIDLTPSPLLDRGIQNPRLLSQPVPVLKTDASETNQTFSPVQAHSTFEHTILARLVALYQERDQRQCIRTELRRRIERDEKDLSDLIVETNRYRDAARQRAEVIENYKRRELDELEAQNRAANDIKTQLSRLEELRASNSPSPQTGLGRTP